MTFYLICRRTIENLMKMKVEICYNIYKNRLSGKIEG
jgi:hypothetical protein